MDVRALSEALGKAAAFVSQVEDFIFEVQGVLDQMSKDERSESEPQAKSETTEFKIPPFVKERSLEEQLDFVLDNMEPSPAVDAMRNHADVRNKMLREHIPWIQSSYRETMRRLWTQWENAEW